MHKCSERVVCIFFLQERNVQPVGYNATKINEEELNKTGTEKELQKKLNSRRQNRNPGRTK